MGSVVTLKIPNADIQTRQNSTFNCKSKNRSRLTEARIEAAAAPFGAANYIYDLEVPGLALRVTPKGVRAFVIVKKIAGRTQRITLGRWPGLRLAEARRAAVRINGEIAAGIDPVAQRKAARARAETCNDFWPSYLAHIKRKNRSWTRDEQRWKANIAPLIGRKALSSITAANCQNVIDAVGATHPVKANRVAALLGAFFTFAAKHERIARNPARGVSRYEEAARERFLSADEVRLFLSACACAPDPWGDFFAVLLWTGARKGAVMAMRWSDIDLQNGVWIIPAAMAKNKQTAAVALVEPAAAILTRRQDFCGSSPWVFPSSSRSGHIMHVAKQWSALKHCAGLDDMRPHDLRRTIGSWLAASGASSFLIQKALTHKSAASARAYAHLDVEAVRAALSEVTAAMQVAHPKR